jgi:hypothetical protein
VSKIEGGGKGQTPSGDDLAAWAGATGADLEELTQMRQRALAERSAFSDVFGRSGGAAEHQIEIAAAESAARRLGYYYPLIVPGLLQTVAYAREMLSLEGGPATYGAGDDDISLMIAARMRRQAILHEPGRQIIIVVGEATLRSRVAPVLTLRAQCEHVASLAESFPRVAIGVVPFSAQLPFAGVGTWSIIDDMVLIETDDGEQAIADPAEVERYWGYLKALLGVAATGADAAALCRRIASDI